MSARACSTALPWHLEPTHGVDRLRGQADVGHHRDLGIEDGAHHWEPFAAPLELDRLGTTLPHQTPGVAHGFLDRDVIAHPGEVAHHEAVGLGTGHRCGVLHHDVEVDEQCLVVAVDHVGQRVTDQDDVHPGLRGDDAPRGGRRR